MNTPVPENESPVESTTEPAAEPVTASEPEALPEPPKAPARSPLPLILAILAVFAWRAYFSVYVNLIPDECSYWTWSRQLDWSYFDNSGMTAYLIRLSTELFGFSTPLSVRAPFLILSVLSTLLVFRVSALLFGNAYRGLWAALLFNLAPMSLMGGSAAVHDNALIFFWLVALWAAARLLQSTGQRWFYVMGVASGLAMLSKYTGVLVLISLFLFLLCNRELRKWLIRPQPWLGVFIAFLFTLPILWWNYNHQWASLSHILFIGSGAVSHWRRVTDGLGYHAAQFLLVSPYFYAALLIALFAALMKNLVRPNTQHILLLSFSAPLFLFGAQAFRGHVEANWAVMGYMSAGVLAVEIIFSAAGGAKGRIWKRFNATYLKRGIVVALLISGLAALHGWVGLLPAAVETRVAKEDRIIWETSGWDGLGRHVDKVRKPDDVIAADSYQLCALLEFNTPGNPRVRYLAPWRRPTQFDVWEPSFDNLKGRNILFCSPVPLGPSTPERTSIYENFASVEALPPYDIKYHGETIRQIYLYRGIGFDPYEPRPLGPRSLLYKDY